MSVRPVCVLLSCALLVLAEEVTDPVAEPTASPLDAKAKPPAVQRSPDSEVFTGRTEAARKVEIRARVTGYLDKVLFKDGTDVKEGDMLFAIDPRPYQVDVQKAEAGLALAEAAFKQADAEHQRARALVGTGTLTREEFDKITAGRSMTEAKLGIAKAHLDAARLTLSFTKVHAPMSGRIGRRLLDPGNIVKADETHLATLVTLDPLLVSFDVDERTVLRLRRATREGKVKTKESALPVAVGLADEKDFPHKGQIDFVDNQVDPATGTLRIRAVLPNPDGLLTPGMFVRVRLATGAP